jgi:enterochelin esterase-like enzyme
MVTVVDTQAGSPPPIVRTVAVPPATSPAPGWRYANTDKRDLRLDLLRGFAVFAMVADHIGGASWLHLLTGGNRFFVSAAEGFVFISGVIVAVVYGERARRDGLRAATGKLLNRAWTLYALAVWLALTTALAAALFGLPRGVTLAQNPARFVIEVVTLRRTFYLVDVMLFYALAMLIAPLALWALARGRWWLLALASVGLWGAYQFWPGALQIPWRITDNPVFNFAAWQILFFGGMLVGHARNVAVRLRPSRRPPSRLREAALPTLAIAFGGLVYLHVTNAAILAPLVPGGDTAAWLDRWFDKSALPFPRLVACAIVFALLWLLVSRFWLPIRRALGAFLLPLGQDALYAYAAHLFVIVGLQLLLLQVWQQGQATEYAILDRGLDTVLQLSGIGLVWALTRARFLLSVTAPLGAPPLRAFVSARSGRAFPRPSDSLLALLLVVALCVPFLIPGGVGANAAFRGTGAVASSAPSVQSGGAQPVPSPRGAAPASTVTVPRSVAGSARGSSGYTGRSDQSGASTAPAAPQGGAQPTPTPISPAAAAVAAPPPVSSGGYLKDGAFYSEALGRTMPYGIYLPPTYDSDPTRHYPVAYMLHGAGGHYSEWVAYGLPESTEDLIWNGEIQPLIIVMPQGDQSYFVNHVGTDEARWGDYIAFDLVAHIDATYRTIPQPSSRAIGGLSMGGFGALQLAFAHPEIFRVVGAHSPALRTIAQLSDIIDTADEDAEFDPLELAKTLDPMYAPKVWVDAGAGDEWADRVLRLGQTLDARNIPHQVQLSPGQHTADYWTMRAKDYVRFYARALVGGPVGVATAP